MMVLTIPQSVKAYDFSAVCSTGQTLYYNYLSSSSVTVTYPGSGVSPYGGYSKPTGGLAIPSSVMHNGITYSVTYIGAIAFKGCSGLTSVTIPNSVTYIGDHAFKGCSGLTSVTIPNSVTYIGDHAFKGCSGLTWVIIGNSVTSIGNHAFYDCSGLTLVTIPNSVTSIGNYAFYNCSGLTWVNIGDSVTSIGNYAFYNCSGLTSVTVESGNTVYDSRGNCNAIIETSTNTLIAGCMNTVIPNSVTSIGDAAFYNCSGLTLVTIPNSVTSIGEAAFAGCSGLTSVTIPNSVTSIGDSAFYYCSGLTSVQFNAENCADFSVDSYENVPFCVPFYGCANISNFIFGGSVSRIPAYCCYGLSNLTVVIIPNSVNSIGSYAFSWCSGLTGTLTIPNSVTSIGGAAFYNCSDLISVTIGNSVNTIGSWAFKGCSALTGITSLAEIPPTLGTDVFYGVSHTIPVHIPCGSMESYQTTWSFFSNLIWPPIHTINVGVADSAFGVSTFTEVSTCDSIVVIEATSYYGYHFTQWNDGNTDNPRTITVTQDTTFTAYFDRNEYQLTLNSADPTLGTLTGSGTYLYLDTAHIVANAIEHHHLVNWSDGDRNAIRDIVITADLELTATFAIDTHTVTVASDDITRGMVEASSTEFVYGTPCTVTATAYTGYTFAGWSNGVTANPYTFTVTEDVELTAYFESATQGVLTVDASEISIYSTEGRIVARGAEGMEMSVLDVMGREVVRPTRSGETPVLPKGVYLVKVGTLPARKVLVIR